MKFYLCQEHGEQFILRAESKEQAQEDASMYGGECIRELTPYELSKSDPDEGVFCTVE